MGYFRDLKEELGHLLSLAKKDERWLILMNADPDALASALALKRILSRRGAKASLAHVNDISRPDNLAMIKHLRIPTRRFSTAMLKGIDRFALVDSQPHHHPDFAGIDYSVVIDHHPLVPDHPVHAAYMEILPERGSNSSILTEYLHGLSIRPGKLLATALMYGVKSDTQSFERPFSDIDLRAFRHLSKYADKLLLRRIVRSEFRLDWLVYFQKALANVRMIHHGIFIDMEQVDNPDILVILADHFNRIHGVRWTVVAGETGGKLVAIFRGDGLRRLDMGKMAAKVFAPMLSAKRGGAAGGHATMARAEIPLSGFGCESGAHFLLRRLRELSAGPGEETLPGELCQMSLPDMTPSELTPSELTSAGPTLGPTPDPIVTRPLAPSSANTEG